MKALLLSVKRYRFFLILLLINIILCFACPSVGKTALSISFDNLLEMLSVIPPIFILLGLMDVWIPKETMTKYMGRGSGIKGGLFAFALGSFSAGPLYASFPAASVFLKKGASLTNIFIFIGAWSTTKIPMMLFEVTQLGAKFAVCRFFLNTAGIIFLAFIMEKTTGEEDRRTMYELAEKQTDSK